MTSGTDRTGVDGVGGDSPVQDPVSWNSQGSGVTLSSAGLYNLDTKVFRTFSAYEPGSQRLQ